MLVGSTNGAPVRIKDIGHVEIGHAPRLGIFGFEKNHDAVEGVILMRRGEQTQNVLKGVEKKTDELNRSVLPPDVKVRPYYDRSDLVRVTTDTVEGNLLRGMMLVLIVLIFFLGSVRAALITALTIPLALLFAFIFLHARGDAANLLSIGAIDFGIIIDGTIVMVENIYRELGVRHGQSFDIKRSDPGRGARRGSPHLLFGRRHHRRVSSHLRAHRPGRTALPPHGEHHGVRADRFADPDAYRWCRCSRRFTFLKGVKDKTQSGFRMDPQRIRRAAGRLPASSGAHTHRRAADFRRVAAA